MHENMHQIIAQVNTLSFNQSNVEHGRLAGNGNGGHERNHGWRTQGVIPTVFDVGQFDAHGSFAPATVGFAPDPPPGIMPYGDMPQGRCTPGFFAPAPPAGIPQEGQTQYLHPRAVIAILTQQQIPRQPHFRTESKSLLIGMRIICVVLMCPMVTPA
jgi:hypothetical protein